MALASPLDSLLREFVADLSGPGVGWQLGAVLLSIALGWGLSRLVVRGVAGGVSRVPEAALQALRRLWFPLLSLACLTVAQPILAGWERTHVVHLAQVLMIALAAIRLVVHVLSRLAPTQAIAAFERTLVGLIWVSVALYVSGYGAELRGVLEAIEFAVGRHHLSLWHLLSGGFWMLVVLLLALWLGAVLEAKLLAADSGDLAVRVVLGRILRAALTLAALLLGMSLVGLDITALSVFGGALGVGLGLGLQRIASSYISGFVILLERRIRIGDTIVVDRFRGQVVEIRTRFTIVRSGEGWEAVVPNELLMTSPVQNFSQQPQLRFRTALTLPYGADLTALAPQLVAAAAAHPRVSSEPGPGFSLIGFGPDGLNVELAYSIGEPEISRSVAQSEVNLALWKCLRDAGVSPAPAQRRVELVPGPDPE